MQSTTDKELWARYSALRSQGLSRDAAIKAMSEDEW